MLTAFIQISCHHLQLSHDLLTTIFNIPQFLHTISLSFPFDLIRYANSSNEPVTVDILMVMKGKRWSQVPTPN